MTKKPARLDELRQAIDRLDDKLVDLLAERTETVSRIAEEKARLGGGGVGGPAIMLPNREAEILRRLVARAAGKLEPEVIVGIWRQLFPAMVRLQTTLEVAVDGSGDSVALWDLARAHFGLATPMSIYDSAHHAMAAVADAAGRDALGVAVVPMPGGEGDPMWWKRLDSDGEATLKVMARLPFAHQTMDLPIKVEALAVGALAPGPSGPNGDDKTLLIVATKPEVSRGGLGDMLEGAGLSGRALSRGPADGGKEIFVHLVEVEGFVGEDDDRLDALFEQSAEVISRIVHVGGYAVPLAID